MLKTGLKRRQELIALGSSSLKITNNKLVEHVVLKKSFSSFSKSQNFLSFKSIVSSSYFLRWIRASNLFLHKTCAFSLKFNVSSSPFCSSKENTPLKSESSQHTDSFSTLGISNIFLQNLKKEFKISQPTEIQNKSIPFLLTKQNCILAAETGSGKTLAYLLPIVETILLNQQPNSKVFIFVPTSELAVQVYNVTSKLLKDTNITCDYLIRGKSHDIIQSNQIIICIPGILFYNDFEFMEHTTTIVLDEADLLLCGTYQGFKEFVNKYRKSKKQWIFAGATLPSKSPKSIVNQIKFMFPKIQEIYSTGLHRVVPKLKQIFIRVSNENEKFQKLLESLSSKEKTLIFVRKPSTIPTIQTYLESKGIPSKPIEANTPFPTRLESIQLFSGKEIDVLISTNMGSRGLDLPFIKQVIQFDFADSAQCYIHRVGRTARAGAEGKSTNFILPKDEDLAKVIEKTHSIGMGKYFSRGRSFRRNIKAKHKKTTNRSLNPPVLAQEEYS